MTRDTYDKYHALKRRAGKHEANTMTAENPNYIPKHAAQWYNVWRVLGPAGPQEIVPAYGLDEARRLTVGCWDAEITSAVDGKVVK